MPMIDPSLYKIKTDISFRNYREIKKKFPIKMNRIFRLITLNIFWILLIPSFTNYWEFKIIIVISVFLVMSIKRNGDPLWKQIRSSVNKLRLLILSLKNCRLQDHRKNKAKSMQNHKNIEINTVKEFNFGGTSKIYNFS